MHNILGTFVVTMSVMTRAFLSILLSGLLAIGIAHSQTRLSNGQTIQLNVQWQGTRLVSPYMDPAYRVPAPYFAGALYDERIYTLPYWQQTYASAIAGARLTFGQTVQLTPYAVEENLDFLEAVSTLSEEQKDQIFGNSEWYPANPIKIDSRNNLGQEEVAVVYYPIQVHRSGTKIRRIPGETLIPFLSKPNENAHARLAKTASDSKLAGGTWHRLAVTADGIYRISTQQLQQMGINTQELDPRYLSLYGKGGGMLPQRNSSPRYDDLPEMAIEVVGEADGVWNDEDYVLFYGMSPHVYYLDTVGNQFRQDNHLYCDTTYYYLNIGNQPGKRIVQEANLPAADSTVTYLRHCTYHQRDRINLHHSGRMWWGDHFRNNNLTYSYTLPAPGMRAGGTHRLYGRMAARASVNTTMQLREGGNMLGTVTFFDLNTNCSWCTRASIRDLQFTLTDAMLADGAANIQATYSGGVATEAWTDFLMLDYQRTLILAGTSLHWGTLVVGQPRTLELTYTGGSSTHHVWDVTDPVAVRAFSPQLSGTDMVVRLNATRDLRLVAFEPASYMTPVYRGTVGNQNLHALPQADYLIITHPNFRAQAEQLGQWHQQHSGLSYVVATPQQIYQEFSSGMADITAIRDFIRMFWLRANGDASQQPKYVLIVGDGSYDYKGYEEGGSLVPTYTARESNFPPSAYVSDDFYTFMDPNEGFWGEDEPFTWNDPTLEVNTMDLAVGRLPVNTVDEAQALVNKLIRHAENQNISTNWKNKTLIVGDVYGDECNHQSEADDLVTYGIGPNAPCLVADKVYLDAYPAVNAADGVKYPAGQKDMLASINNGALIVNYTGHGGTTGLSNSQIFEATDIANLKNDGREAVWITATCDFGRFDQPSIQSGAEQMMLLPSGGSIAMITSTREVFSSGNYAFNLNIYRNLFERSADNSRWNTIGEAVARAKNATWANYNINTRNFMLLGDPAMAAGLPTHKMVITHINDAALDATPDTLKALDLVKLRGEVQTQSNQLIANYNGQAWITVYDKQREYTTRSCKMDFKEQKNILFNGTATVTGGVFELSFVVPKDINYTTGSGLINLYALAEGVDAGGCSQEVQVCCTSSQPQQATQPPTLRLYLNDENWRSGSLTHPNPNMYAVVETELGINTTGLGIGREPVAILDGNVIGPILLSDFYQSEQDDYRRGRIVYPFQNLSEGHHTLEVRVWDVSNQAATAATDFVVAGSATMALDMVMNYPNPTTGNTTFSFSHNLPNTPLDVELKVYDQQGRIVTSISAQLNGNATVCNLPWDGTQANGSPLAPGLYTYSLTLTNATNGEEKRKINRLVLLR